MRRQVSLQVEVVQCDTARNGRMPCNGSVLGTMISFCFLGFEFFSLMYDEMSFVTSPRTMHVSGGSENNSLRSLLM